MTQNTSEVVSQYETQSFNVSLAMKYGIELAILIQFFINCINVHKRLNRNFKDGRTWNFCTRREICAHFPFWTQNQVRRFLEKLVKMQILKTANYNKMKGDHTVWYAFENEQLLKLFEKPDHSTPQPEARANPPEVGRNSPSNTTNVPTVLPKVNKDNVFRDRGNVDNSKPPKPPIPKKTLPLSIDKKKTLDASRRWKLTEQQIDTYNFLESANVDTDSGTMAYWSKIYSLERIIDVYNEAKLAQPDSIAAYMQKLLKTKANVSKGHAAENKRIAEEFKENSWPQMKIMKKYCTFPKGNSSEDMDYNMQPIDFYQSLIKQYEYFSQN